MKPSIYFYVKPLSNTAMAKIYICERMGSAILSRKSSGITIPTKAWDDKKRTIKAMKDFDPTDALKKLEAISSKYSPSARLNESDEICFLEFAESRIKNYPNPSTRIKYRGVFKIVKRFMSHELQVDKLKISLMKDHSIVARLKSFIQYPSDTTTGSGNGRGRKKVKTIKHYVSVLNNFIAIYNNEVNPSSPIPRISKLNLGREEKPLDRSLTIEEIRKIISFEPVERKKQRLRTPSKENLLMAKYLTF